MTDSAIETLAYSDEVDAVLVPAYISENETSEIQGMVRVRTVQINEELATIGQSMVACAEHLHHIRQNLKKQSWTQYIKSGCLACSAKQAQDLENSWGKWLCHSEVEPKLISPLSARSLNAMANATKQQREKVYAALEAGKIEGSEREVKAILNPGKKTKAKAGLKAMKDLPANTPDKDKVAHAIKLINKQATQIDSLTAAKNKFQTETIKLKGELAKLKAEYKAKSEAAS